MLDDRDAMPFEERAGAGDELSADHQGERDVWTAERELGRELDPLRPVPTITTRRTPRRGGVAVRRDGELVEGLRTSGREDAATLAIDPVHDAGDDAHAVSDVLLEGAGPGERSAASWQPNALHALHEREARVDALPREAHRAGGAGIPAMQPPSA